MRYRIYMLNNRNYDVNEMIMFNEKIVKITTCNNQSAYINPRYVVSIDIVPERPVSNDKLMTSDQWEQKVKQMDRSKSRKKFKNLIRR